MNDNIFAEIEVMEARNASFEEYFHKILEITNRPQNKTEEALLVYKIISTIKKNPPHLSSNLVQTILNHKS